MLCFIQKKIFQYKIKQSLNNKLYISDREHQLNALKDLLNKLSIVLEIASNYNFINNFLEYVKSYLIDKSIAINSDILIVGSNAKLNVRINGANYLSQGKQVISICHGEHSSYVLDEPVIGHTEISYCSDYITYGISQNFNTLKYAKSLYILPIIHYKSSKVIKSFYEDNLINKIQLEESNILYIPTAFSANKRYGPFRDIEDNLYKKWQNSILSLDYNITYKAHPKNNIEVNLKSHKTEQKNLQEVLLDYDFYILDYISTASALCVATDKPIIYFNIGMRNMTEEVLKLFKKRVFWVDIDMNKDFSIQIKQAISDYTNLKQDFINEYTEKYSLANYNKSEIEILEEVTRGKRV